MNFIKSRSVSNYRVNPMLVKVGREEEISIYPVGAAKRFDDGAEYTVSFIPREVFGENRFGEKTAWDSVKTRSRDGVIKVKYTFSDEEEWVISVVENKEGATPTDVRVYALEEDLYELDPYKGDLHVHSCRSDGKDDPCVLAANYRKEGFDFFALTDHHKWEPSEEMIRGFDGVRLGIKLFHGEEVHIPTGWIHMVNFGGEVSVNELYHKNRAKIDALVLSEAEKIDTPRGVNAIDYAYRRWITEEIRKGGGLSIVPHPNWIFRQTYNMSMATLDYVFKNGAYDAFELIGGQSVHENNMQTAFYNEQRAMGRDIPVVGSSDSHGTDPACYFGIGSTIVFAKDMELSSIIDAIKGGYSVAIEKQTGEEERVYGKYRMVKYARFLIDCYFPLHDEWCVEEGVLMREYIMGDKDAGAALTSLSDRVAKKRAKLLRGK